MWLHINIECELNYSADRVYDTLDYLLLIDGEMYGEDNRDLSADEIYSITTETPKDLYKINGAFCCTLYNKTTQEVFLFNDLFGIKKLFYFKNDISFTVSDDISSIMRFHNGQFHTNFEAWCEIATIGFTLGNKTVTREILALYRTEIITLQLTEWTISSLYYDRFRDITVDPKIQYEDALQNVIDLLDESLQKLLTRYDEFEKIVTLSGGWDSRLLSAMLKQRGVFFKTQTTNLDNGNSKDYSYAKIVAEYLGVENQFVDLDPDYFERELEDYLNEVDFSSTLHPWLKNFLDNADVALKSVNFDGLGGDNLLRAGNLILEHQTTDELYRKLKVYSSQNSVTWPINRTIENIVKKNIEEEYLRYDSCDNSNLFFVIDNRYMRNISYSIKIQSKKMKSLTPFLYRPLVEYILSLPVEVRYSDNFYPDILEKVYPGLSEIISTNSKNQPEQYWCNTDIYKINTDSIKLLKAYLVRHSDLNFGLVDPIRVKDHINLLSDTNTDSFKKLLIFNSLSPFLHFSVFIDKYRDKLVKENFFDTLYYSTDNHFQIQIAGRNSDYKRLLEHYHQVIEQQRQSDSKLDVLLTMDVEGFPPRDMYSVHSSKYDYVDNLIFCKQNQSWFERLFSKNSKNSLYQFINKEKLPLTYFVEIYSSVFKNEMEIREVLDFFNMPFAEVGLHCHPFSLSRDWFQEGRISLDTFLSLNDYKYILNWGKDRIIDATGLEPLSYRSGSFWSYPVLFQALYETGFKIDSSLFHSNQLDFSGYSRDIENKVQFIDGILEIPVTTFYNLNNASRANRFDFNSMDFEQKLQLLSQSVINNAGICNMLFHSWSFSQIEMDTNTQKLTHQNIDNSLVDEFKWLVEFVQASPRMEFKLCRDILSQTAEYSQYTSSLMRLGNYTQINTVLADFNKYIFMPYTQNMSVTVENERTLRTYINCEENTNAYIQLFDGQFTVKPSDHYIELARLENVSYFETTFEVHSEHPGSITVFFMEYNEVGRIGNSSSESSIKSRSQKITVLHSVKSETTSFKLAIKYNFAQSTELFLHDLKVIKYYK